MTSEVVIIPQAPDSALAQAMLEALWAEIQRRYEFSAPNGIHPEAFSGPRAGFWVAMAGDMPVGSIAIKPLGEDSCELDAMYVAPEFRGAGVAQRLLDTLEAHARRHGFTGIRLRAGGPQPEAVRFYEKMGFYRIPCFGHWIEDRTAWCFEKLL